MKWKVLAAELLMISGDSPGSCATAVFMPRTVECAMCICCYFRCDSAVVVHLVYPKSKRDVNSLAFFCPTVISDNHCWLYDDALFSSSYHRRDKNILKPEQLIVYR